jgi:streptogramin lyase
VRAPRGLVGVALAVLVTAATASAAAPVGHLTTFSAGLSATSYPSAITAGPDGNLWFLDNGDHIEIGQVTPAGRITEFPVRVGTGGELESIAAGPDGDLWFTSNTAIGRLTPSGHVSQFAEDFDFGVPGGLALGPDGNVWFTLFDSDPNSSVVRITPDGVITRFSSGLPSGSNPVSIAQGADGNMWFVDNTQADPTIGRITPSGVITEFPALGHGRRPLEIAAGPDGNLWFTDVGRRAAVGRITPSGHVTEFSKGLQPADNSNLQYIAAGPDGNVWFTDDGALGDEIGRITPSGQIVEFPLGPLTKVGPSGIVAGPDGNVWFATTDTHFSGEIGRIGTHGTPSAAQRSAPAVVLRCSGADQSMRCTSTLVVRPPATGADNARAASLASPAAVVATGTARRVAGRLVVTLTAVRRALSLKDRHYTLTLARGGARKRYRLVVNVADRGGG